MKKNSNKYFGCISRHFLVAALALLLVLIGPALIAIDLTYLTEWINSLQIADFYTYLTFIGVVSVWSIFGFIMILMRNVRGFTIYMIGLCFITVVQFIIGFVHIMLLFTTYRPVLLDTCLQRQPSRYFWWSMGYEDNQEMEQIYELCSSQWNTFATERLISWIAYSFFTFACVYFVFKYQRYITYQHNKAHGQMTGDGTSEWSDDEDTYSFVSNEKKGGITVQHVTYHNEASPPAATSPRVDNELTANMYQQRQKLFDEIAKRKRARKNINRKSLVSNSGTGSGQQSSNRDSTLVVHPLDLAQDPEVYQPPPMPPPADVDENWSRYHDNLLREDQEAIERQKRVDALSTERMEYEMYRSSAPSSRKNSLQSEVVKKGASRRKRPNAARWSSFHSDTSNTLQPLASTSEEEHGYEEPEEHMQKEHGGYQQAATDESMPATHEEEEEEEGEDTYDDIQHEEHLDDEDEENSSLLMKPSQEESIE